MTFGCPCIVCQRALQSFLNGTPIYSKSLNSKHGSVLDTGTSLKKHRKHGKLCLYAIYIYNMELRSVGHAEKYASKFPNSISIVTWFQCPINRDSSFSCTNPLTQKLLLHMVAPISWFLRHVYQPRLFFWGLAPSTLTRSKTTWFNLWHYMDINTRDRASKAGCREPPVSTGRVVWRHTLHCEDMYV